MTSIISVLAFFAHRPTVWRLLTCRQFLVRHFLFVEF